MTVKKFLSVFILTFFVKFGFSQVYQSMPQYGYGPVKRMDIDSSLTIPTTCGVPSIRTNLTRKSAIAFDTCNNRFYFYNSKTLVWDTIRAGSTIDTANRFVNSVTKVNDSTIRVVKGTTTSDIVINPQATRLVTEVYNKTGSPISKGAVVYINGKHSNNQPSIALAEANNEANSYKTFALVADNIPNMSSGYVIQAGTITGLNLPTNTYTDGDILYLSPTVAGGYTTTKPLAPNHIVKLGSIVNAHPTQGRIEVKIENGWQLDELSDVSIPAVPADSVLLQFSRVDSLWHDVSPTTAIGNRYIKPSDTASMLTNYAKTSLVNTKLNTSDSTIYFTRFRSDTMRTNIYGQLAQELNVADTAAMLSKYLRRTDTASLSSRIDAKFTLPSFTSGSVLFSNGTTIAQKNANFFWDNSNNRLGIGTSSPSNTLQVEYAPTANTQNVAVFKNTSLTAANSYACLALDASNTSADQQVDIRFGSSNPRGLRIYASNVDLGASPAGAGFQFYSTSSTNFPGQVYFDGGAHNSSALVFRTAQTAGTITQRMRIFAGGNVNIGSTTSDAGYLLNVQGTIRGTQFFLSALNTAPASATATGTTGEIRIDANFIYICTATNTWKRVAISTW